MNTTQSNINESYYSIVGAQQFYQTIEYFKNKAKNQGLTAKEHILYNMVRNLSSNRGFTNATNKNKLANGYAPDSKFKFARNDIVFSLNYSSKKLLEEYKIPEQAKVFLIAYLNKN